jgi:hypothetical protein
MIRTSMKLRLLAVSFPGIAIAAFAACSSPGGENSQSQSQKLAVQCYDPTHLVIREALWRCEPNTPEQELEGYVGGYTGTPFGFVVDATGAYRGYLGSQLGEQGKMTVTGVQNVTCPGLPGAFDSVALSNGEELDGAAAPLPSGTLLVQPNLGANPPTLLVGTSCEDVAPLTQYWAPDNGL